MIRLLFALALATACTRHEASERQSETAPSSVARPALDPGSDPSRFECKSAAYCRNSCAYGAVSSHWYEKNRTRLRECKDGCANQVAGTPRCEDGNCVAYRGDGTLWPECTRRPPPER